MHLTRLHDITLDFTRLDNKIMISKNEDGRTEENTNGVTWSLLELLIAAKNCVPTILGYMCYNVACAT